MQNRGLLKYKIHHLFFWLFVAGTWYFLRYQDYATKEIAMQITLLKVAMLALMIYLTNGLLIPQLLYKKRYIGFAALFLLLILAGAMLKVFAMGKILGQPELYSLTENLKVRFYENVISDFFLVATGSAFKLMFDYAQLQQRMAETAKEKAEAELNFLKSQINPHFLFNSLNSVYFLIDKDNAEARQSLHKFSDMLRYQLYEANGQKIPIEKEVHYLRDYVDLQKLRKDENYVIAFESSPSVKGFAIEPLLLIPFVENAFKHLSHFSNKNNFVHLSLARQNGHFHFSVENSKEKRKTTGQQGGIGLANVRRRLELLYPGNYLLCITDNDDTYKVALQLNLDE